MNKQQPLPFMVSVLLAIGAWVSCSVAVFSFSLSALKQLWLTGLVSMVFAGLLGHVSAKAKGTTPAGQAFLCQLSLAFSLVGKGLLVLGMVELFHYSLGKCFVFAAFLALGSYLVFKQKMDRVLTTAGAGFIGVAWLLEQQVPALYMQSIGVGLFLMSYALFLLKKESLRPLAWALLLLCTSPLMFLLTDGDQALFAGFNQIGLGVGLLGVYVWQTRKQSQLLLAILILILTYITNTATAMGGALLALGFMQKNLYQKIAGAFTFGGGLIWLYYHMQTTLLVKSYYLAAAGLVLLGVYAWLKRGKNAC